MRSVAAAFSWEIARRHRWGFAAIATYFAVLCVVRLSVLRDGRFAIGEGSTWALAVVVPLASSFMYLLAVFSHGLGGDVAARRSMYPARMFTLPVASRTLVGWPMFLGCVAMLALWAGTRGLALWPEGAHVPVVWPGAFAVIALAWTQALMWTPFAARGLRPFLAVAWLGAIGFSILLLLEFRVPERTVVLVLLPQLPLAYWIAHHAVQRARAGERGVAGLPFTVRGRAGRTPGRDFRSATRAQTWLEWQTHGTLLPTLVAATLPFEALLLFVFRGADRLVLATVVAMLVTPPILATFVAPMVGARGRGETARSRGLFHATRPLQPSRLLGAKLAAAGRSAALTWGVVVLVTTLGLALTGTLQVPLELARNAKEMFGAPRATAIAGLAAVVLVTWTWSRLVGGLAISLRRNVWLSRAGVFVPLVLLSVAFPVVVWLLRSPSVLARLWPAVPALLAAAATLKVVASALVLARLATHGLLRSRALLLVSGLWSGAVFATFALLAWIFPEVLVGRYLLLLLAILLVPLTRGLAALVAFQEGRST